MAKKITRKVARKRAPGKDVKIGAPSKYDPETTPIIAQGLYRMGLADEDVAKCLKVTRATLHAWKKKPDFIDALKKSKDERDEKVESALFRRACGWSQEAEKIQVLSNGHVVKVPYIEKFPPDTTACIFWLKNTQPEKWRDKTETDLGRETVATIANIMQAAGGPALNLPGSED